jgi:hypothetical protein
MIASVIVSSVHDVESHNRTTVDDLSVCSQHNILNKNCVTDYGRFGERGNAGRELTDPLPQLSEQFMVRKSDIDRDWFVIFQCEREFMRLK